MHVLGLCTPHVNVGVAPVGATQAAPTRQPQLIEFARSRMVNVLYIEHSMSQLESQVIYGAGYMDWKLHNKREKRTSSQTKEL